jgi:hypothetical protein
MKKQLTNCLFFVFSIGGWLPPSSALATSTVGSQATPSQAYFLLATDIAKIFQQLEQLPTAQATVLLRQKSPALKARIKQVKPAYQKYLKFLSSSELKAENQRMASSYWGAYFAKAEAAGLDTNPKLKALLKPGNPSGQAIMDLMGVFAGI